MRLNAGTCAGVGGAPTHIIYAILTYLTYPGTYYSHSQPDAIIDYKIKIFRKTFLVVQGLLVNANW